VSDRGQPVTFSSAGRTAPGHVRSARPRAVVAILMAAVVALTISGVVIAQDGNEWSPEGCTTNGIEMTLSRTPTVAQPGDEVTYTLTVSNPVLGPR
jgi:hypothetical protein